MTTEDKAKAIWGSIIYREGFSKHQILREDLIIECAIKLANQQSIEELNSLGYFIQGADEDMISDRIERRIKELKKKTNDERQT